MGEVKDGFPFPRGKIIKNKDKNEIYIYGYLLYVITNNLRVIKITSYLLTSSGVTELITKSPGGSRCFTEGANSVPRGSSCSVLRCLERQVIPRVSRRRYRKERTRFLDSVTVVPVTVTTWTHRTPDTVSSTEGPRAEGVGARFRPGQTDVSSSCGKGARDYGV